MLGDLVEHMVIEPDTGVDPHRRLAVEIDLDGNRRLACLADMARHPFLSRGRAPHHAGSPATRPSRHLYRSTRGWRPQARLMRLVAQDISLIRGARAQRVGIIDNHQQVVRIRRQDFLHRPGARACAAKASRRAMISSRLDASLA